MSREKGYYWFGNRGTSEKKRREREEGGKGRKAESEGEDSHKTRKDHSLDPKESSPSAIEALN